MDSEVVQPDFAVLGDPTRANIARLIAEAEGGRALVGRLADTLALRQPTVSHHMKALFAAGIVERQAEGRRVWYSLNPEHSDRIEVFIGRGASERPPADLDRIADDLAERYRGTLSRETIDQCVRESHALLATASSGPLLASRTAAFAADRLGALLRADSPTPDVPEVLFVCVQNAGRSQLAAGILRQLAGDRVTVRTAGSAPAAEVRASIVTALDEIGVPVGAEFPKPLTDDAVRAADVVITMGCGDACPIYPGRRYLDWDLDDPVGLPLEQVRRIRDDIEARVRLLLAELDAERSGAVHAHE